MRIWIVFTIKMTAHVTAHKSLNDLQIINDEHMIAHQYSSDPYHSIVPHQYSSDSYYSIEFHNKTTFTLFCSDSVYTCNITKGRLRLSQSPQHWKILNRARVPHMDSPELEE